MNRREHVDAAGFHVVHVHDAQHPGKVIRVTMRMNDGDDRAFAQVVVGQLQSGARSFGTGQRVDDDPSGLAAHERHVGDVEGTHLVDAVDHLVKTGVLRVELRLTPKTGIDGLSGVSR